MTEEQDKKKEEQTKKKEPDLKTDKALYVMFTLILISVVFLLSMRYIERDEVKKTEITVYITVSEIPETEAVSSEFKININEASEEELMQLPGIGEEKAKAILEYRKEYGYFYNAEELLNVRGIGEKILSKIKDYLIFE